MAYGLLEKWGHDGFLKHVEGVAKFYREKRDMFVECLNRHMTGLADWAVPDSGMFVWLRLLGGIENSYDLIMTKAVKHNVLAVPGVVRIEWEGKRHTRFWLMFFVLLPFKKGLYASW